MLESRLLGNLYGRFGGGESEKYQQWQLAGFLSCGEHVPKPLWQRWHQCACGVTAQRDLYSAFLAAYLDPPDVLPSCARYQSYWEGREPDLRAAYEQAIQRASAGQYVPRSFGIPGDRARLPKSPSRVTQEPACPEQRRETWKQSKEPPVL